MYVSIETLRRAVRLIDSLAELDDPAGFADIALPGLAAVVTAMARDPLADLTGREAQILGLVADGRTNLSIAHVLEVSPRTVAKHLEHIYRKLGVSSRAAAVSRARVPAAVSAIPAQRLGSQDAAELGR